MTTTDQRPPSCVIDCDLIGNEGRSSYTYIWPNYGSSQHDEVFAVNIDPKFAEKLNFQHSSIRGYMKCAVINSENRDCFNEHVIRKQCTSIINMRFGYIPENGAWMLERIV